MSYTLNVEREIVDKAEAYAFSKGTSLDNMIRACMLVIVSQSEINNGAQTHLYVNTASGRKRINIGSLRDEVRLPENFDNDFSALDEQVVKMFEGAVA